MESLVIEFDENHMWKEQTWLVGSSPALPSNFRMSEGSLVDIEGQRALWFIGLFINWLKFGRLNPTIKGSMGATGTVPETILLNVTTEIELDPTTSWVPTPAVDPSMVTICSEGGSELDEESDELGEESVWRLRGL